MTYQIRNWEKFQHFKDRRPSWIKLYRDLLENYDWYCLSGQAAKSLIMLWLLSSESDGVLPPRVDLLFRLRLKDNELDPIIDELVNRRFLVEADAEYKQMSSADYAKKNGFSSRYIKDSDKQIVFDRDGGVCRRCNSSENIEYDHVIPVSKGGSSSPDNLQLLCRSCNRKKRAALSVDDNCAMRSLEKETETETYTETETETETVPKNGTITAKQVQAVVDYWNAQAVLPTARGISEKRDKAIRAILKDAATRDCWKDSIDAVTTSEFHLGKNERGWKITFDWWARPEKVLQFAERGPSERVDKHGHAVTIETDVDELGF